MAEYKIKWAEPPASRRGQGGGGQSELSPLLAALRGRPGEWARIVSMTTAGATAAKIKAGQIPGVEAGEFETTSRTVGKTNGGSPLFDIYARYVGDATR